MLQFGLTRNKDSVILRPKIDKRNKRPPLALENLISAPGSNSSISGKSQIYKGASQYSFNDIEFNVGWIRTHGCTSRSL